jgi:hypothetical protein
MRKKGFCWGRRGEKGGRAKRKYVQGVSFVRCRIELRIFINQRLVKSSHSHHGITRGAFGAILLEVCVSGPTAYTTTIRQIIEVSLSHSSQFVRDPCPRHHGRQREVSKRAISEMQCVSPGDVSGENESKTESNF